MGGAAAPGASAPPRCANCAAEAGESYCPRCGQETHDLHRSLTGIVAETLDTLAGWDGKIPATLWLLIRRPGALTAEFLAGRRARYLRPLRLYLTLSVAFFLSVSLVDGPRRRTGGLAFRLDETPAGTTTAPPTDATDLGAFAARRSGEEGPGLLPWFRHRFKEGLRALARVPPERRAAVLREAFMSKVGNTVFLLLPVFAGLLRLFYRRAPLFVAEHLVFALHVHAFAMLAMTASHLLAALPWERVAMLAALPQLWLPVYLFVAMRRVYGGSRAGTAVKYAALTLTYAPIFLAATALTAILALFELGA